MLEKNLGKLQAAVVALGLTTISMAWLIEPLVEGSPLPTYHWAGRISALFGPAAVYFFVLWAAVTLFLLSARRNGRWRVAVWAGILVTLPWIVLRTLNSLWPTAVPHWVHLPHIPVALAAWLLIVVLWRPSVSRHSERVIEFASTVLAFMAIPGVLLLGQFTTYWWKARSLNDDFALTKPAPANLVESPRPRIIWIVLDELSYQQVYEHRYPGLQLPAFDALAATAVVFTDTVPEGIRTERVLPSLFTGNPVKAITSSASGELWMQNRNTGVWHGFDQHNTVFQDALNAGYQTGVAGWYNPYCRILSQVLDRCSWNFSFELSNGLATDRTFKANMLGVASILIGSGTVGHVLWHVAHIPMRRFRDSELQLADFRNIFTEGDQLLQDRSIGFVLLHLPIPHPGGIYNRATGQFTTGPSTYIDNLALADKYVAHVRSLLEQTGQWDSSTLIVMGDHSWRTTMMWEKDPRWTPEEQRASFGGRYDSRPAYIVKLAGQQKGTRIDAPFQAVRTRSLMDALFGQTIRTPQVLSEWVSGASTKSPDGKIKSVQSENKGATRRAASAGL